MSVLFIYPMWDNESQRIGKKKCTPLGYTLHGIAELIGFAGLLLLIGVAIFLGYRGLNGTFHRSLLWLLAIPFGIGVVSQAVYQFSWVLATRKGFSYDYEKREASWDEGGERLTYRYESKR